LNPCFADKPFEVLLCKSITFPIINPASNGNELEVLEELDKRVSPKPDVGLLAVALKLLLNVGY